MLDMNVDPNNGDLKIIIGSDCVDTSGDVCTVTLKRDDLIEKQGELSKTKVARQTSLSKVTAELDLVTNVIDTYEVPQ